MQEAEGQLDMMQPALVRLLSSCACLESPSLHLCRALSVLHVLRNLPQLRHRDHVSLGCPSLVETLSEGKPRPGQWCCGESI